MHYYLAHDVSAPRYEKINTMLEVVIEIYKCINETGSHGSKKEHTICVGLVVRSVACRMNSHPVILFVMYSERRS